MKQNLLTKKLAKPEGAVPFKYLNGGRTSYFMKNINYDLVKLLHMRLDSAWRLEKYYINDANVAKCHSAPALEKMLEEDKRQIKILQDEIKGRITANVFD